MNIFNLFKKKETQGFKYRQRVRVIEPSSFYANCVGEVDAEVKSHYYPHKYKVGLLSQGKVEKYVWIPAHELEAVNW